MHYTVQESKAEMMELCEELPSFDETLSKVKEETGSKESSTLITSFSLIMLLKVNLREL